MWKSSAGWIAVCCLMWLAGSVTMGGELELALRRQQETSPGSGRYHRLTRSERWQGEQTAIIVCDVWDLHHCLNAVRRAEEFAPRLNQVLIEARKRGVTVIHAPSDCMPAYADHPARQRAMAAPRAADLPEEITAWCSRIPAEEQGVYPIDQSDGGEDDDPAEHVAWAAKLKAMGRNPGTPWKKQSELVEIDAQRDYISDRGDEVWNVLQQRGIQNVILAGVHTNMCVLGRPFGLRQMARNGKHVVLMRDMTDTMYNPQRWPYVSHFTGTDLIIGHIEKFVCPTMTSDQLLGGKPFRFAQDRRPHVVLVMAEDEYQTERTLPEFAAAQLGKRFRVSYVFGSDTERNEIPGLEAVREADVLLLSVRRRVLPAESLKIIRDYVAAGKPVVGIRTASHAFSLRGQELPEGFADWPELDAAVWGGNYQGHHGNQLRSMVERVAERQTHPILSGLPDEPFAQGGSLYKNTPLAEGAVELLRAKAEGQPDEPVAWTFQRADGGRSFYTSLGQRADFENPAFVRLLANAIAWAAGLETDSPEQQAAAAAPSDHWTLALVPASGAAATAAVAPLPATSTATDQPAWYRCVFRLPAAWQFGTVKIQLPAGGDVSAWCNGQSLRVAAPTEAGRGRLAVIPRDALYADDANLLVLRMDGQAASALAAAPTILAGEHQLALAGRWQLRRGDDSRWSNMPLPAKFGAPTDIVYQP
ncbi:MAG: isochorismatase family protein [Pirellulaceae bacterium]|nr:isochorismatase family protein [Pirellulaceae bacterium]